MEPVSGHIDLGELTRSQGIDEAEVPSLADFPGEFESSQDGGSVRKIDISGLSDIPLRSTADAAAVKKVRLGPADAELKLRTTLA